MLYFYDRQTGELRKCKTRPSGRYWKQIDKKQFDLLLKIATYAMSGWYAVDN